MQIYSFKAEKVSIEETIGYSRVAAHAPKETQIPLPPIDQRECKKVEILSNIPVWMEMDKLTPKEIRVFKGIIFRNSTINDSNTINYEIFDNMNDAIDNMNGVIKKDTDINNALHDIINQYNLILSTRNSLIQFYNSLSRNISLKESFLEICKIHFIQFNDFLEIFDFYEDSKVINYGIGLSAQLEELVKIVKEVDSTDVDSINETENNTENTHKFITSNYTKASYKRYINKDILLSTKCACGRNILYFSSYLELICENCYKNGLFPKGSSARNFHKLSESLVNSIWTKKEEYLLLKGIEEFGDDWKKVSLFVNDLNNNNFNNDYYDNTNNTNAYDNNNNTNAYNDNNKNTSFKKTISHCIFHFINLCILEDIDQFVAIPFSSFQNQVSTFIAFLSCHVDPEISVAVAKEFLRIMKSCRSQTRLMDELINLSSLCAKNILKIEDQKLSKIQKVRIEALIKKITIKINSILGMEDEIKNVKQELIQRKGILMEEIIKMK